MTRGYGDLMSRPLPKLHETWGKAKELVAGWGEGRATFVANEKWSSKLLLQKTHAGADGRLCDVQTLGGFDEAAGRNDLEKCPSQLDVHFLI